MDKSNLKIDYTAVLYLETASNINVQTKQPIVIRGDGNYLFNAVSIALSGNDNLSMKLRVRTCI